MKQKKLLILKKRTISTLNQKELAKIIGGATQGCPTQGGCPRSMTCGSIPVTQC